MQNKNFEILPDVTLADHIAKTKDLIATALRIFLMITTIHAAVLIKRTLQPSSHWLILLQLLQFFS